MGGLLVKICFLKLHEQILFTKIDEEPTLNALSGSFLMQYSLLHNIGVHQKVWGKGFLILLTGLTP